jgi:phosphoribosylaminoimidazole-succinocarboxamide synthase
MTELIVRHHIAGSYWRAYDGVECSILGHRFPGGLDNGADLGKTIFTPSTKAEVGHDENISEADYVRLVRDQFPQQGRELAEYLREKALAAGEQAYAYCRERGIVFLDSKFEFGVVEGTNGAFEVVIIDEAVTPDSSRFCKMTDWEAGNLIAYDKELVRQYVLQAAKDAGFPMGSEGFEAFVSELRLPPAIIEQTSERYREIGKILMS